MIKDKLQKPHDDRRENLKRVLDELHERQKKEREVQHQKKTHDKGAEEEATRQAPADYRREERNLMANAKAKPQQQEKPKRRDQGQGLNPLDPRQDHQMLCRADMQMARHEKAQAVKARASQVKTEAKARGDLSKSLALCKPGQSAQELARTSVQQQKTVIKPSQPTQKDQARVERVNEAAKIPSPSQPVRSHTIAQRR